MSARLRIGLIAPPWVPVPPPEYGGTEVVIDALARGLVDAGHDVSLFTTGDSTCPVPRRWTLARAAGTTAPMTAEIVHVGAAYEAFTDLDVVHDHTLVGPLWAIAGELPVPVATTVHGELTTGMSRFYELVDERVAVIAISRHQRSTAPQVAFRSVIHHGIDMRDTPVGAGDGGYVLFLGRMSEDKGVHRAIQICRAARKRLLIVAKMWEPDERRYFQETVAPMLGNDAVYLGQQGGRAKQQLLAGAEALVNPIRWNEPFGLVMVEALAAGTPVLTFAEGAAPEIVDDGRTGFICEDEEDMAAKLRDVGRLDRAACRHAAEQRFTSERMVADHLVLYRSLLDPPSHGAAEASFELLDLRDDPWPTEDPDPAPTTTGW